MALLEVLGLSVHLGPAPILTDLSFTVERGETVGLVGESGCGKSMTALAVMALLPDRARTAGHIRLGGVDLLALDEPALCKLRGRKVAMVFQEPMTALNPVRSIGAQVAEAVRLHLNVGRAESDAQARRMLDRVGLPAPRFSASLYPHQLSGGQRQRVMIAAALACGPDLLIADEPTTALDVTIQAQILDLLRDLAAERRMAMLLITHDLGVVGQSCDRTLVMYAGRVAESGPTESVFRRRAHPYTHGLFAASPRMMAVAASITRARLPAIPGLVPDPLDRPPGCAFAARCPHCQPDCLPAPPPLRPVGEPSHAVACLHPAPPP